MPPSRRGPLGNTPLPAEIVLHPSWWHRHEGITFDRDFFFDPRRRVEEERRMEQALYERWGRFGLGADRGRDLPQVGAVHLAAGFLLSEMLGCRVDYLEDAPPQVIPAGLKEPRIDPERAFESPAFRRFEELLAGLKERFGYLTGDVNWAGVLNIAMDLRGQAVFLDMVDRPEAVGEFFHGIAQVVERFTSLIRAQTGTTSISVNRTVRHIPSAVHLHSECSHTMISVGDYERHLRRFDRDWSRRHPPYGIHYCGADPERYAESFAAVEALRFLDAGWGGDVAALRARLPETFLNIRLSPVELPEMSPEQIRDTVRGKVRESGDPFLTGICCVNMDWQVRDDQVAAIFEAAEELRSEMAGPPQVG